MRKKKKSGLTEVATGSGTRALYLLVNLCQHFAFMGSKDRKKYL